MIPVKGSLLYEFKENEYDVHIIDAELKDDPTFKFKICTGFSEVPTFKIEYDLRTNYFNVEEYNIWYLIFKIAIMLP